MSNFELFTMLFFELDYVFEKQAVKDDALAQYLSEINPFIWEDCSSADPAHFYTGVCDLFLSVSPRDFATHAQKYLSAPHKNT